MNVLHVISSGGMYGAEAVILNLSTALNASPALHRSSLAAFTGPGQSNLELFAAAAQNGVEAHPLSCQGAIDRRVPATLRALVEHTHADVVHAHGYKADLYSYAALRGSAVPLVSTCHTWYDNDVAVRVYGALDRWALRRFNGVVAVSDAVRERLLRAGVKPERVRLIRNGIAVRPNARPKLVRDNDTSRVGLVGRLAPEKGVDTLMRAAALVLDELPRTRFSVAGDGPDRAALEALRAELGLQDRFILEGRQEDMAAFYGSLDLLVSASRQEGLPVALLEGMASGLALVATAVGDVPTLVEDGVTGTLVKPDDPAALANAIVALLRSPARRHELGVTAQALVAREYSAERMAAEYLALYEHVVASADKARALR